MAIRRRLVRRVAPWQNRQNFYLCCLRRLALNCGRPRFCVFYRSVLRTLVFHIVGQELINYWGANEHGWERGRLAIWPRAIQECQIHIRHEALPLPSEVIPVDSHIKSPDEVLAAFLGSARFLGEKYQPSAGPPRGFPPEPRLNVLIDGTMGPKG